MTFPADPQQLRTKQRRMAAPTAKRADDAADQLREAIRKADTWALPLPGSVTQAVTTIRAWSAILTRAARTYAAREG